MKKIHLIAIVTLLLGCGGSLSDEQRKKLHEGMEDQKIVRLSDSEIVTASLEHGRVIYEAIEKVGFDPVRIDSLERQYHVSIKLLRPGSSNALEVENQLIEAYVAGAETGSIQDNIQKLHTANDPEQYDSLMYTRPKVSPLPDGAVKVEGVWNIHFAKKDVVRSLAK
jgi:ribosome maturation protein Sdo1